MYQFEVYSKYMIIELYYEYGIKILEIIEAPTVRFAYTKSEPQISSPPTGGRQSCSFGTP